MFMHNRKKRIGKYYGVVILLFMSLLVIPTLLFGENAFGNAERESEEKSSFELTVKDDLITLSANDASLKEIVEEIGEKMNIKAVANIHAEEKISVEFERLSLTKALEKLSSNYGYIMNTEKDKKKIARIFVLPKGKNTAKGKLSKPEPEGTVKEKKTQLEPFKFEFDPSEFVK